MAQHYSDPKRESDPHALPDVEVFYQRATDIDRVVVAVDRCDECRAEITEVACTGTEQTLCVPCARETFPDGWYWWSCFPGCLPDGDPSGPFATEAEALADARDGLDD